MRALLLVAAIAIFAPTALATQYSGTILVGHPLTQSPVQAINERLAPCDPDSPYNGLDSVWFDIGTASAGKNARLTMDVTLDADAYFWSADCRFDGTFGCASQFQGTTEHCLVPTGARYISVAGWSGTGSFVLHIT